MHHTSFHTDFNLIGVTKARTFSPSKVHILHFQPIQGTPPFIFAPLFGRDMILFTGENRVTVVWQKKKSKLKVAASENNFVGFIWIQTFRK
jgi:hypothetical protein